MFLENNIGVENFKRFKSFRESVYTPPKGRTPGRTITLYLLAGLITLLCLPWTQNVRSSGIISTLNPQQRPQQVNSFIAGRVAKWSVKEGDYVRKGDTLVVITEIKEEYLDPAQLQRLAEQIEAKGASIKFYRSKAETTDSQSEALNQSRSLKLNQLRNKLKQYQLSVQSDSMSYVAAESQLKFASEQMRRQEQLFTAGLKSLTELEQRKQAYLDALSKKMSAENKFYNSRNELSIIEIEQSATEQEYREKILKASGDGFSALSDMSSTQSEVAKLRNLLSNYKLRRSFYVITAPQSGQVIKTGKAGIGETVKEGDALFEIVPISFDRAVEIFVDPIDLPLIGKGQEVRLQFDGFPAIVFSGWPNSSYGTFPGRIAAIDPSISLNGKFRVWITPVKAEKEWPRRLSYGTGAKCIALLNDVPIGYELWRKLSGFPPEYYTVNNTRSTGKKQKNEN